MKKLLIIFLTLSWAVPGWAQILTAVTEEGVEMQFEVVDEEEKLCVTLNCNAGQSSCIPFTTRGKITIPEIVDGYTVCGIGCDSFANCYELGEIVIPESVLYIDECAFDQCFSLSRAHMPQHIYKIGARAFSCTNIQEVTIGSDEWDEEVIICEYAFAGSSLKKLVLKDNVSVIGENAFAECSFLEDLFIPKNVEKIFDCAFQYCTALKTIVVDGENGQFDSRDNCNAIIQTKLNRIIAGCNNTVMPEGIEAIASGAFNGLSFTSVFIPKTIKQIGNPYIGCPLETIVVDEENLYYDSRESCNAIINTAHDMLVAGCKNTVIPNSVKIIEGDAFRGCAGIEVIVIPEGVTHINSTAFCALPDLRKVTLPSTLQKIGDIFTFAFNMNLETVVSYIQEPFEISEYTFITSIEHLVGWDLAGHLKDITLYVPKGTKEAYQTTRGWNMFANIIEMDDNSEVKGIDAGKQVQSVRYHNLAGMTSDQPFPGINLVTTTYTDGTTLTTKVIK